MSNLVVPNTQAITALENAVGVGGVFEHVTVRLFINDVSPTKGTLLADLTEASFPGYVGSHSITWGLPFLNASLNAQVAGDSHQFQPSDSTTPQTAYGWFGVGTGADSVNLKGAERFDTPQFLGGALDIVIVLPQISQALGGSAIFEGA